MTNLLDHQKICALLDEYGSQLDLEVVTRTGSTNSDLMARLPLLRQPVLRVAEIQTAGRGRAGRAWHAEPGGVLTFSLAWRFSQPAHALLGLSLAVGVAVAEVLQSLGEPVLLKWPNDILKQGKKLGGILIETASGAADPLGGEATWAVIGIGLNLQISPQAEAEIGGPVADAPWLAQMDRNALLAQLANALARALQQFDRQGFSAFMARWNALHAHAQQPVRILDRGTVVHEGAALGVDLSGCLVLQTAQGQVTVMVGDVSLRPA